QPLARRRPSLRDSSSPGVDQRLEMKGQRPIWLLFRLEGQTASALRVICGALPLPERPIHTAQMEKGDRQDPVVPLDLHPLSESVELRTCFRRLALPDDGVTPVQRRSAQEQG